MSHLTDAQIAAYFSRPARKQVYAEVSSHLLGGCAECQSRVAERLLEEEPLARVPDLAEILSRAYLRRREYRKASLAWASLVKLPERGRIRALQQRRALRTYGFALYLLDRAEGRASKRRFDMAEGHLRLADALIEMLPAEVYGSGPIMDLRLRCEVTWAHLRRSQQNFTDAKEILERAEERRKRVIDQREHARFWRVRAALLWDLGDFEESAACAKAATNVYASVQDSNSWARSLMQEGVILANCDPSSGLAKAKQSLASLPEGDVHLFVRGVHTVALCLIKLGLHAEARRFLDQHEREVREVLTHDADLERLFLWIEGYMLQGEGRLKEADQLLGFLSQSYSEEGLLQEVILVQVDRIGIKVQAGKWKAALTLARQLTPLLGGMDLRYDIAAMWASVQEGIARQEVDVRELREFIARGWRTHPG